MALVPTMGALHTGHEALIRCAAGLAHGRAEVIVSIFVNPAQFGPSDDFERYPRPLEADCERAAAAGAGILFAPDASTMYPAGVDRVAGAFTMPALPAVATQPQLEDAHRPGHFAGVCKVVARLFDLVHPRWAVFGEKDFQQLLVVESMVREACRRWGRLEIVSHETVREADGLAMSSRNGYLRPGEREHALGLKRALDIAKAAAREGRDVAAIEAAMRTELERHDLAIDYAAVRHSASLLPCNSPCEPRRALIAARSGNVRLIDNAAI